MLFLYSAVLSLSVIASNHIVIAGGEYSTWEVNRISPYGYGDQALFAFAFILCLTISTLVLALLFPTPEACEGKSPSLEVARLNRKPILLMSVVLFALYLPYLLAYWPGLIFGDSVSSLSQSLGFSDYSNHHPLAFALCVKACLFVAHMLGLSNSAGCALFTIIQMVVLSLCFATAVQWVMQRTGCRRIWRFVLLAFFGIPPLFRNLHHCHVEGPVVLRGRVDVDVADFRPGGIEGARPSNRESLAACIRPLVPGRIPVQKQRNLGGDTARDRIGRDGAARPERI